MGHHLFRSLNRKVKLTETKRNIQFRISFIISRTRRQCTTSELTSLPFLLCVRTCIIERERLFVVVLVFMAYYAIRDERIQNTLCVFSFCVHRTHHLCNIWTNLFARTNFHFIVISNKIFGICFSFGVCVFFCRFIRMKRGKMKIFKGSLFCTILFLFFFFIHSFYFWTIRKRNKKRK